VGRLLAYLEEHFPELLLLREYPEQDVGPIRSKGEIINRDVAAYFLMEAVDPENKGNAEDHLEIALRYAEELTTTGLAGTAARDGRPGRSLG
jgi:hypothetical protein